jgi:hypothetical protein
MTTKTSEKFVWNNAPPMTMLDAEALHKDYKRHFGKTYATPEEEKRAIVHLGNAAHRVLMLNASNSSVQYEINEFSDMSPMEFNKMQALQNLRLPG